ncbi:DUF3055 domain-containing protein [Paenibacillus tarimensis]
MFEHLYDVSEQAHVQFVGLITERARYDFSIVFTNHFFGKPLVICMQTGRSSLLCADDLCNLDYLQQLFRLENIQVAEELRSLLLTRLPSIEAREQY